ILGLSAIIAPLIVAQRLVRRDVPIMIAVSVLLLLLALDGSISRLDGILLVVVLIAYTVFLLRESRQEASTAVKAEYDEAFGERASRRMPLALQLAMVAGGLGLLVVG